MENGKKIKFFLGIGYTVILIIFLWVFFTNFSIDEIRSYEFIKNNREDLLEFKNSHLFFTIVIFFFFTIIWVLLLGFGTPIALLGGFIFGPWLGTFIVIFSLSIGATLLYIFANFFLKKLIKEKFEKKF